MSKAADLAKFIGNNEQNMKLLLNATISSAVAQYDIDSTYINSTYDTYKVIGRIALATDNENIFIRFFSFLYLVTVVSSSLTFLPLTL